MEVFNMEMKKITLVNFDDVGQLEITHYTVIDKINFNTLKNKDYVILEGHQNIRNDLNIKPFNLYELKDLLLIFDKHILHSTVNL